MDILLQDYKEISHNVDDNYKVNVLGELKQNGYKKGKNSYINHLHQRNLFSLVQRGKKGGG